MPIETWWRLRRRGALVDRRVRNGDAVTRREDAAALEWLIGLARHAVNIGKRNRRGLQRDRDADGRLQFNRPIADTWSGQAEERRENDDRSHFDHLTCFGTEVRHGGSARRFELIAFLSSTVLRN